MPMTTAKMTNAVSRVSSTTVRKRMIASAPTRLNARAVLSPITWVTMAIRIHSSTSVEAKFGAGGMFRSCVRAWTAAMTRPRRRASPSRRASTSARRSWLLASDCLSHTQNCFSHSGINSSPGRTVHPPRPHTHTILRRRTWVQSCLKDQVLEQPRQRGEELQLEDRFPREQRHSIGYLGHAPTVGWGTADVQVNREPHTPCSSRPDKSEAVVTDPARRSQPARDEPLVKPVSGPGSTGEFRSQPPDLRLIHARPSLGDAVAPARLALQEQPGLCPVAAQAILTPAVGVGLVVNVEAGRVEIETVDAVSAAQRGVGVRVGSEVTPRPGEDALRPRRVEQELQLERGHAVRHPQRRRDRLRDAVATRRHLERLTRPTGDGRDARSRPRVVLLHFPSSFFGFSGAPVPGPPGGGPGGRPKPGGGANSRFSPSPSSFSSSLPSLLASTSLKSFSAAANSSSSVTLPSLFASASRIIAPAKKVPGPKPPHRQAEARHQAHPREAFPVHRPAAGRRNPAVAAAGG